MAQSKATKSSKSTKSKGVKSGNKELEALNKTLSTKGKQEVVNVEAIKESLRLLIKLGMAIKKAAADNKITFFEGISLIAPLADMKFIIANIDKIRKEHSDLDDQERAYIIQYFKKEFSLSDNHLEEVIENGFEMLFAVDKFVSKL